MFRRPKVKDPAGRVVEIADRAAAVEIAEGAVDLAAVIADQGAEEIAVLAAAVLVSPDQSPHGLPGRMSMRPKQHRVLHRKPLRKISHTQRPNR